MARRKKAGGGRKGAEKGKARGAKIAEHRIHPKKWLEAGGVVAIIILLAALVALAMLIASGFKGY